MWAELLWFVCGNFKISVTMATGVGQTQISLTLLNQQTPKTPYLAQESWWYLIHKLSYSRFSDKIYQFLLPWQQGWVERKFEWLHLIGRPQNPRFGAKFSYLSQMRAELLWFLCGNFKIFVTMATGVGLTEISLTQLNRMTPKTPYLAQVSWWYLTHKLSYSRFSDKIYQFTNFCYHGNKGGSSENLNDSVWSANPQNPQFGAEFWDLS